MNELIKKLIEISMIHNDLMIYAHQNGLQGVKRFNRYESIENMKRVQELENYMVEYKEELAPITYQYTKKTPTDVINLLVLIRDSRKSMITALESVYKSTADLSCKSLLCEYEEDFRKEWQVYNREIEKLDKLKDIDMKWEELYRFDKCQHKYMKEKE